jgi:hypothetical protein
MKGQMMKHAHAGILRDVKRMVEVRGGECWRTHQGGGPRRRGGRMPLMADAGILDMCCVFPKRVDFGGYGHSPFAFWFDAKVGKDKPTPEQLEFAELWKAAGIDSVFGDLDDAADYLCAHGVDARLS